MKKLAIAASLLIAVIPAYAAVMGILVHSESTVTMGGSMGWKCTYSVMGKNATVVLTSVCPPTMNFD